MRDLIGLGVAPALLMTAGFAAEGYYTCAALSAGVCGWFVYKAYRQRKELTAR